MSTPVQMTETEWSGSLMPPAAPMRQSIWVPRQRRHEARQKEIRSREGARSPSGYYCGASSEKRKLFTGNGGDRIVFATLIARLAHLSLTVGMVKGSRRN